MKAVLSLAALLFVVNVWAQDCGVNEVRQECGPVCEGCGAFHCDAIRCGNSCFCRSGFLRDATGTCIPADQCPGRNGDEPSTAPQSRSVRHSGVNNCWGSASCDE